MRRTQARPLPAGRLNAGEGTWFGVVISAIGLAELAFAVNVMSASVAGHDPHQLCISVYTPLKPPPHLVAHRVWSAPFRAPCRRSSAGRRRRTVRCRRMVLFGIVFFWRSPHFLAIMRAWLYRDDYARAGDPLLPVLEPDGQRTGQQALSHAAALWPVSLLPAVVGLAGVAYVVVATVLGLLFIWLTIRPARGRSMPNARTLFLFSITYLPLLLGALVADRLWI